MQVIDLNDDLHVQVWDKCMGSDEVVSVSEVMSVIDWWSYYQDVSALHREIHSRIRKISPPQCH